ncbi:hypothetical protein P22_0193 [Propionispora sp. 2/2-37]|uniref:hypothetical protein n=1 Tax=Propionispora sp. 2/2-37 TaxID=1677858 RepID=UPI0006BB7BC2|nr:hypothetical protein [Propionispora sp. 2/2-37]CUH94131.1 hypothetical protein P22_0193 [Propionispora sp. 2/2-37]
MYKLIIGNVRITVYDDAITRQEAAVTAKDAIHTAETQGKQLSHIELQLGPDGIEVKTTEKIGNKALRKTVKHSMLDGMLAAVKEKLSPTTAFSNKELWIDGDTGQEWRGSEVASTRDELLAKFEEWLKQM